MGARRRSILPPLCAGLMAAAAAGTAAVALWSRQPQPAAGPELLGQEPFWRVFVAPLPEDGPAGGDAGAATNCAPRLPAPAGWAAPEYDASGWGRIRGELFGGYGYWQPRRIGLLCLRGQFAVADPGRIGKVVCHVTYRGGAIVRVNGEQIARAHMPEGEIGPGARADPYPIEAYVEPGGKDLLQRMDRPARKHAERYELRVRELEAEVPPALLRRGANTIAIELRAARLPELPAAARSGQDGADDEAGSLEWNTAGFYGAELRAGRGAGGLAAAGSAGRDAEARVWNADALDAVKEDWLDPSSGCPEPLKPVRMAAPRNGVCSGQVVVSRRPGLGGVRAEAGALAMERGGAAIPPEGVVVRYAAQREGYCDALEERPREGARVQPVWLVVQVPKGQQPGLYAGRMTVRAGEREFAVPVELRVLRWTLPDPALYATHVSLLQSPDTVAARYAVEPYSERHFELLRPSLEMLGQVGNDVVYVPVIRNTHLGNNSGMVRWVKGGTNSWAVDTGPLEKFLDLYEKHAGPPKVLCLDVWNRNADGPGAPAVTQWDPAAGKTSELAAPRCGAPGSEEFWKPLMDGVRRVALGRGWDERRIMVGVATDWWPSRETVAFFRAIAPYARWAVFSHGRGRLRRREDGGRLVLAGGMEVGYNETPFVDVPQTRLAPWTSEFRAATSMRGYVRAWSHPSAYRNLVDMSVTPDSQGLGRVGLDYWEDGGRTLLGAYEPWHKVFRNNPCAITVAGPAGALPTVRFQMLREGVQEAEARVFISLALEADPDGTRLGNELRRRCAELLGARAGMQTLAVDLPQQQISCGWQELAVRLHDAAAEVADRLGGAAE